MAGNQGSLAARVRRLRGSRKRSVRGAAELSVLAVVASLITGVFFGQGISTTAVDIADGLTWISDSPSGDVIQVNPATGRPQVRYHLAQPGDDLTLAQYDGRLFVTNRTTGILSSIDVSRVLTSAARRVTAGTLLDTLVRNDEVYLVDREQSTISRVDPDNLDELGTIWTSDTGLADAALDDTGTIWALEDDGTLHTLTWSTQAAAFDDTDTRTIDLSGPGSVLVAHDTGVTVFGPDQGIVEQINTPTTLQADAPRLRGELRAPETSPPDLAPAAAPDTSTVILTTPQGVLEVDVAAIGCPDPGTPEVFENIVYVPCLGSSKVIRLAPDGTRALPDINTPGTTNPELVLDDGTLIVNTPGAPTGAVVTPDGTVNDLTRYDPTIPTLTPATTNNPPPNRPNNTINTILANDPPTQPNPTNPPPPTNPNPPLTPPLTPPGNNDQNGPGPSLPSSQPSGPAVPTGAPTGPGSGPSDPSRPSGDPSTAPTVVPSTAPSTGPTDPPSTAVPTTPAPSTPAPIPTTPAPTVPAPTTPAPTAPAPVPPPPSPTAAALTAPTGVTAEAVSPTQIRVSWTHPGADEYVVSDAVSGDVATVPGTNRQATVTVATGVGHSYLVTAVAGGQRAASGRSNSVTTSDRPGRPAGVDAQVTSSDYKTYRVTVTWGAAADNGSPITGYQVSVDTEQGTRNATTDGAGRSATVTFVCPEFACTGDSTATVVAVNAVGTSDAASNTGAGPTPPPPALPGGGTDHVTSEDIQWSFASYEGQGDLAIAIAPPGDWAAFAGTCRYTISGAGINSTGGAIGCAATSLSVNVNHGIVRSQNGGQVTHRYSITFIADNGSGTVSSARHDGSYQGGSLCSNCPVP